MPFILVLLIVLVACLGLDGVGYWYLSSELPVPLSYLDIQHREDYEKLIDILVPTTKAVLERDGEVAQPIAFGIEVTDRLDIINPEAGSTLESLQLIVRDFKQGAHNGYYRSVAVAYDITRHDPRLPPRDGIEYRFENVQGESIRAWFPYHKLAPHKYWYGAVHFVKAPLEVFSHHNIEWGDGG